MYREREREREREKIPGAARAGPARGRGPPRRRLVFCIHCICVYFDIFCKIGKHLRHDAEQKSHQESGRNCGFTWKGMF